MAAKTAGPASMSIPQALLGLIVVIASGIKCLIILANSVPTLALYMLLAAAMAAMTLAPTQLVLAVAVLALVMALPSLAHVVAMVPQTAAVVAVADGIVLAEMVAPV